MVTVHDDVAAGLLVIGQPQDGGRADQSVWGRRWQSLGGSSGLGYDLVGGTLGRTHRAALDVLVVDEDVDLKGLHVDERLGAVAASKALVARFLKDYQ